MLPRHARLRHRADFAKVYEEGRFEHSPMLTLHLLHRGDSESPRIGIVAGRKLGSLARRARWKRRVRAALRQRLNKIEKGLDIVLVLRTGILAADYPQVEATVEALLRKMGALRD